MIRHYIKVGYRNIARHLSVSLIATVGYALTLSIIFPVILLVNERATFDDFHDDNIYRVTTELKLDAAKFATTPSPLADHIQSGIAGVSSVHSLLLKDLKVSTANDAVKLLFRGALVDDHFFDTFNVNGINRQTVENLGPKSIIITAESANRLFSKKSPLGEVLSIEGVGEGVIRAVLPKSIRKSHLDFEIYLFASEFAAAEGSKDWNNYQAAFTYVVSNDDYDRLLDGMQKLSGRISNGNLFNENLRDHISFGLQPLSRIATDQLYGDTQAVRHLQDPFLLFVCCIILFLLATINFFNLFASRSITRVKEFGVRKIFGVKKMHTMMQYFIECLFILLLSSVLGSILFLFLPFPEIKNIIHTSPYPFALLGQYLAFLCVFAFATAVVPFLLIKRISIVDSLKTAIGGLKVAGFNILHALLGLQLCFSLVVLIVLYVFVSQSKFAVNADYGFNADNVWSIELEGTNATLIENKLSTLVDIQYTSVSSGYFGRMPGKLSVRNPLDSMDNFFFEYGVGSDFINLFDLQLVAGTGLTPLSTTNEVMLNEAASEALGYQIPQQAIGGHITLQDSVPARIAGIIKNFHYDNFKRPINPLILHNNLSNPEFLLFKTRKKETLQKIKQKIEPMWKEYNPNVPLNLTNYSQLFKKRQAHSDDLRLLSLIGGYILAISLLNLLGITLHHMKSRAKDISIYKIHGASYLDLTLLLSKVYIKVFSVTPLIAIPVAYIACKAFLNSFTYKIELDVFIFLWPCLTIFLFVFSIVYLQALKISLINPVKNLRYE